MNYLKAFALAFNMLSILPFFKVHTYTKNINAYSAMFYPLVGFILGSILFLVSYVLEDFIPAIHLGVLIFSLWVLITGALHLDGLSDTIDGFFVDKTKALEVMKDSHVGGMGMIFTFVFLSIKLSSVIYFNAYHLLPIILMLSRLSATLSIYFFDYISHGVGMLIKEELKLKHILFTIFYSLLTSYYFSSLTLFILTLLVVLFVGKILASRLSGLNGDMYGFIIEITEVVLLNFIIINNFI